MSAPLSRQICHIIYETKYLASAIFVVALPAPPHAHGKHRADRFGGLHAHLEAVSRVSHSLSVPAVKGVCWTEDQRAVGVSIKPPIRNPPTRAAGDGLKIFPAARTQDGTLVWKRDLVEECRIARSGPQLS